MCRSKRVEQSKVRDLSRALYCCINQKLCPLMISELVRPLGLISLFGHFVAHITAPQGEYESMGDAWIKIRQMESVHMPEIRWTPTVGKEDWIIGIKAAVQVSSSYFIPVIVVPGFLIWVPQRPASDLHLSEKKLILDCHISFTGTAKAVVLRAPKRI